MTFWDLTTNFQARSASLHGFAAAIPITWRQASKSHASSLRSHLVKTAAQKSMLRTRSSWKFENDFLNKLSTLFHSSDRAAIFCPHRDSRFDRAPPLKSRSFGLGLPQFESPMRSPRYDPCHAHRHYSCVFWLPIYDALLWRRACSF
jgi:hypothetical protein